MVDFWLWSVNSDMRVADETNTKGRRMINEAVIPINEYVIHVSLNSCKLI